MDILWWFLGMSFGIGLTAFFIFFKRKKVIVRQADVLINRIQKICKLVTVEGEFSEIVKHKDSTSYFFSWLKSEKSALLIVKAQVHMGYDFKKMDIRVHEAAKKVTISKIPQPEIISMQTDVEYYDVKNGTLNRFKPEDYENIQKEAKEIIIQKVKESQMNQLAQQQFAESMHLITEATKMMGWSCKIKGKLAFYE